MVLCCVVLCCVEEGGEEARVEVLEKSKKPTLTVGCGEYITIEKEICLQSHNCSDGMGRRGAICLKADLNKAN
jgi:hypothetical protein